MQSNSANIEKCIETLSKTKLIPIKPTLTDGEMLDLRVRSVDTKEQLYSSFHFLHRLFCGELLLRRRKKKFKKLHVPWRKYYVGHIVLSNDETISHTNRPR